MPENHLTDAIVFVHMNDLIFEDELYDMTETVIPFLAEYFNASYVAEEFPIRSYRTDLALVQINFALVRERLEKFGHLTPILKNNRQSVYNWLIDNGPVTEDEFMEDGPYAKSYKMSLLNWLVNRGYVEKTQHSNALPDDWPIEAQGEILYDAVEIPFHSTIFAVELKQKNWEYAIEQANRAYEYADFWFVCMDAGGVPNEDDARAVLDENGAGLLAADRDTVWMPDWSPIASNRFDDDYECWYKPDNIQKMGRKQRWRLNEESLAHLKSEVKDGEADRLLSVTVDEREKT